MESTINKRIDAIIKNSGLTITSFAKKIGVAQTSLRDCVKNNAEPKYSTLNKIIIAEPLISSNWLLTGDGEMIKQTSVDNTKELDALKLEILMLKRDIENRDITIDKLMNKLNHTTTEGNTEQSSVRSA